MANGSQRISELLSTPMEAAVVGLAVGIARAQRELDRHSIELQREIDEDPELAELGLHATWYQMPHAELELTMTITLEEETSASAPAGPVGAGPVRASRFLAENRLHAIRLAPVNAFYKNQFDYDVTADRWTEVPGDHHKVSANASATQPARLLAIFVVDTAEQEIVIPDK